MTQKSRTEVQAFLDEWKALQEKHGVRMSYCCCMGVADEDWEPLWDADEGFYMEEDR